MLPLCLGGPLPVVLRSADIVFRCLLLPPQNKVGEALLDSSHDVAYLLFDPLVLAVGKFARRKSWEAVAVGADAEEALPPELHAEVVAAVAARGGVFQTLGSAPRPNRVVEVTPAGLYVETVASLGKGTPPPFIPAWMFTLAWDYLRTHGHLSNRFLLANDGLNVKRSSAVCAILATLPGVHAVNRSEEGIVLSWTAAR